MFRALERGDLKVIWIQTTNPWVTLPNLTRYERTPDDGRFIIVSDIYPTPTTAMADLILPSAGWVEKEGVFGNTERRTQHWKKLVEPPGEAREDAWQIVEVARRMGFGDLFPWPGDWHKPMYEEYRQFTLGVGKDVASYDALVEARGLRWPVVNGKETKYRYAAGYDPYVEHPKNGVEFYKAKADDKRATFWLRPYQPPAESPDDEYPLWLTTGRVLEHWHTGSMTRRTRALHQAVPEAYVEINPADAERLAIVPGELVRLVSRRGQLDLKAVINGRGQPPQGLVFVPFFDESKLDQLPDPGRDGQHQLPTGLQEVRHQNREDQLKRKRSRRKQASLAFSLAAFLLVGCNPLPDFSWYGSGTPVVKLTASTARAGRRAFDGGPPVIPHEPLAGACINCHDADGRALPTLGMAPANPHLETPGIGASANCKQCHVFRNASGNLVANTFKGLPQDLRPGSPKLSGSAPGHAPLDVHARRLHGLPRRSPPRVRKSSVLTRNARTASSATSLKLLSRTTKFLEIGVSSVFAESP